MQRAVAAIALLTAPAIQETHELKWNLRKDQAFTCAWMHHVKTGNGKTDIRFELSGGLVITEVTPVGADGLLAIGKLALSSKDGDKVSEFHFENGKLVKPEAPGENDRSIADWCAIPVRLRITPWGAHLLTKDHYAKTLFEAQNDCFGTHLPTTPVRPGGTWDGWSENFQLKMLHARPVKVSCKLESLKNDVATIVVNDRQEVRLRQFTLDMTTVSEARFHPVAGYCSYYSIQSTSKDLKQPREAPDKPDVTVELKFEMNEKKK